MVLRIVFTIGKQSFRLPPANLVQTRQSFVRNAIVQKGLHSLNSPPQSGSIDFLKWHMLISIVKCFGLQMAFLAQFRFYIPALNNAPEVVPGLCVPDQVYFFYRQRSSRKDEKIIRFGR